jgi:adenylate cyclase
MGKKIKRKFLISTPPEELLKEKGILVRQGYLCRNSDKEIRINQSDDHYAMVVKTIRNRFKEEIEIDISKDQFEKLWPETKGLRIIKSRVKLPYNGFKVKVDTYLEDLEGLVVGRIDFNSHKEMLDFELPPYFHEELSFDYRLKESHLVSLKKGKIKKILPLRRPGTFELIGVLPYVRSKKTIQIMLITTRGSSSWIFPKGQAMRGKSNEEVSRIEALEEAGIKGEITGNPLLIPYQKGAAEISMLLYPMEISNVDKNWIESKERERKLCPPHRAYNMIAQKGLRSALGYLDYLTS